MNRPDGDQGVCDRLLGALGGGDSSRPATPKSGHSPPGQLGTPRQSRPGQPAFVITHYAGPVTYSGKGLLDKNKVCLFQYMCMYVSVVCETIRNNYHCMLYL